MPKREDLAEREKKNFVLIYVLTRPGEENSKKNSKKLQKIKKVNSGIISFENGLRKAGKEREKF